MAASRLVEKACAAWIACGFAGAAAGAVTVTVRVPPELVEWPIAQPATPAGTSRAAKSSSHAFPGDVLRSLDHELDLEEARLARIARRA